LCSSGWDQTERIFDPPVHGLVLGISYAEHFFVVVVVAGRAATNALSSLFRFEVAGYLFLSEHRYPH